MAHITHDHAPRRGILETIMSGLNGVLESLASIAENSHRMREIERLQALSDDELAARGLTRQGIAHHVFRDVYYV
ncbi:DUF1127 domain-containing protein [Sagittula salina]|uniref:DUF1127 domain-containing protein n=1 Tax=Sagittula salina TaxID=2820268 RepID=A0A940MVR7_9RHOB|nr:DUF1127 domain-containing protein [Sagittula salina]MBP0483779.1 DUF1127 domain-containing protein [Sagittula salina]